MLFSLRLFFILSLIILAGVIAVSAVLRFSSTNLAESRTIQVIDGDNQWILQCDITNNNATATRYSIVINVDGVLRRDSAVVQPGKKYTYTSHVYPQQIEEGKVEIILYEEGNEEPVEKATYYLNSR